MTHDTTHPVRCHDCANRKPVTGACGHDNRQALVAYFADGGAPDCPCYVRHERQ